MGQSSAPDLHESGVLNGPANGPTDLEVLGLKVKYKQAKHGKELMSGGKAHRSTARNPSTRAGQGGQKESAEFKSILCYVKGKNEKEG